MFVVMIGSLKEKTEFKQALRNLDKIDNIVCKIDDVLMELHIIGSKIDQLTSAQTTGQGEIMADLGRINDEIAEAAANVQANTDVTASASVLLNSLSELIRANATDPEALNAIADSLDANNTTLATNNASLSAAVAANTPAG